MSALEYEQVEATAVVKDVDDLTIPGNATAALLQATEQDINYTLDDSTDPTAGATGVGMRMIAGEPSREFLIDDVRRIRFIRGAGSNAQLNIQYFAGRDV